MAYHIGVGGAWKQCTGAHVGVGGAWKRVQKMYIGVGGVWKQFYSYLAALINDHTLTHTTTTPANATSGIKIDTDGNAYRLNGGSYVLLEAWLTGGGTSADYECRWTTTSGTLSSGVSGSWQACNTSPGFNRSNSSDTPSTETCVGTLEIRMAASPNTVFDSATITLNATVSA